MTTPLPIHPDNQPPDDQLSDPLTIIQSAVDHTLTLINRRLDVSHTLSTPEVHLLLTIRHTLGEPPYPRAKLTLGHQHHAPPGTIDPPEDTT